LKSQSEWRVHHRSGQIPRDIPINVHQAYADVGWAGWGDWLGTGRIGPGLRQYRTFIAKKIPLLANRSTSTDHWISAGIGRAGFSLGISVTEDRTRVECFISVKEGEQASLAAFKKLYDQREALEAKEKFGEALDWQELPGRKGCRICKDLNGGWRTPEAEWPAMQDAILDTLVRLEAALRGPIQQIG
jgi:hypothetical protein